MPALSWTRKPSWGIRTIYKLEESWLDRMEHTMGHTDPLSDEEQIELSWLGFIQSFPLEHQQRALIHAATTKGNIESYWALLHPYGNVEYAHLVALSQKGRGLHILAPIVFQEYEDVELQKSLQALTPKVLAEIVRAPPPLTSRACYHLGVVGFSLLSTEQQHDLVHQQSVRYPSPEWWARMHDLVYQGLGHLAHMGRDWDAKRKQKIELALQKEAKKLQTLQEKQAKELEEARVRSLLEAKKQQLNRLEVPKATTPAFQEFLRDVMFGKMRGEDPYPVYPFYIKLPEGYMQPAHIWDVEKMLQESTSATSASDGCKTMLPYLQPHQAVVHAMLQLRAQGLITTPGLLAMHSTGAGKTLLTLCALLSFWNLDKVPHKQEPKVVVGEVIENPVPIFLVSVKSNQNDNGLKKLAQYGMTFFPDFEDFTVPKDHLFRFPFAALSTNISGGHANDSLAQEHVALHIQARLRRGFITAAKDAEAIAMLKKRGRDLYTFETLGHDLEAGLYGDRMENALFVIDEAHYMNLPYHQGGALANAYQVLLELLQNKRDPSTTWCLAMTATPGETKTQLMALLRAVGTIKFFAGVKRDESFASSPSFASRIRGLVSYAQLYGDYSHFARMEPFLRCFALDPSSLYGKLYQRALCKIPAISKEAAANSMNRCKNVATLSTVEEEFSYNPSAKNAYYRYLRARSNFILVKHAHSAQEGGENNRPRRVQKRPDFYKPAAAFSSEDEEDKEHSLALDDEEGPLVADANALQFPTSDGSGDYTVYVSPKLQAVLENILKSGAGKHFVYSADKNTIGVLAHLLRLRGVDVLLPRKRDATTGKWTFHESEDRPKKPRFILLDNLVSKKKHVEPLTYRNNNVVATGKHLTERIEACKQRANAEENKDGSDIQVILATADHFKGVDINHLKYLHLVDAMADYQDFVQFIGRGSRYCSHRLWKSMASRKVQIFMYHVRPAEGTEALEWFADPVLWNGSLQRYREQWGSMEAKLQEASVDYLIFKDTIHANTRAIQASLQHVGCMEETKNKERAKEPRSPKKPRGNLIKIDKGRMREKAARQRARLGLPTHPV